MQNVTLTIGNITVSFDAMINVTVQTQPNTGTYSAINISNVSGGGMAQIPIDGNVAIQLIQLLNNQQAQNKQHPAPKAVVPVPAPMAFYKR